MDIKTKDPVASASGKVFGARSRVSLRTNKKTGNTSTYTWPENYQYPVREKRVREQDKMRVANAKYQEVKSNDEMMHVFRETFEKQNGRLEKKGKQYVDLYHFILGWYMQQLKEGVVVYPLG